MKELVVTIDIHPDFDKAGCFKSPLSFNGLNYGFPLVCSILSHSIKKTLFLTKSSVSPMKYIAKGLVKNNFTEIGVLFFPDEYGPNPVSLEGVQQANSVIDCNREIIKEKICNCLKYFYSNGLDPKCIRFGSYGVDIDTLEWLSTQDWFNFTHSSTTVPTMLSNDNKVDHRLYPAFPWKIGNLIEVPSSVFNGDALCWLRPTLKFGLLDNMLEIVRQSNVMNLTFGAVDYSPGAGIFAATDYDVIVEQDRLSIIIDYMMSQGVESKFVSEIITEQSFTSEVS